MEWPQKLELDQNSGGSLIQQFGLQADSSTSRAASLDSRQSAGRETRAGAEVSLGTGAPQGGPLATGGQNRLTRTTRRPPSEAPLSHRGF